MVNTIANISASLTHPFLEVLQYQTATADKGEKRRYKNWNFILGNEK
jgi:hypothetical protein